MNYRDTLYSSYVSTHTGHLYGETTIEDIKGNFPVWESYFGRFLPEDRKASIIDIGCGNGGFVYWLQERGYENARGVDISPEQLKIAEKLGIKKISLADMGEFLDDEKNTCDVIFARDVIEHNTKEEILGILQNVNKALKDEGLFIVLSPNGESPFNGRLRFGDFTHEMVFTRSSLKQILKAVGFRETGFYSTGPVPKGLRSLLRYSLWKGIESLLRFYSLVETGSKEGIFTQTLISMAKK